MHDMLINTTAICSGVLEVSRVADGPYVCIHRNKMRSVSGQRDELFFARHPNHLLRDERALPRPRGLADSLSSSPIRLRPLL